MNKKGVNLKLNAERFSGEENVRIYDKFRPTPPDDFIDLMINYAGGNIPCLIDIGCGSGLSVEPWVGKVDQLFAIDPGGDMLAAAKQKFSSVEDFHFIEAFAHDVPLQSNCADMITCSQAFHWMEPESTLLEVNRLLRSKGVFVVYDCMWPPSTIPSWEQAFVTLFDHIKRISEQQTNPLMHFWDKNQHATNIKNAGCFSYVKEVGFHKTIKMDPNSYIGLAESQGGLHALLKIGMTSEEIGWEQFKEIIKRSVNIAHTAVLHYKAVVAIK